MIIAIVGSRTFNDVDSFNEMLDFISMGRCSGIVSGGAKGADALGKDWASLHEVPYYEFPAEWDKFGKSAGFKRNQLIVNKADVIVAFWDGKSKGTAHTLNLAKNAKKHTMIFYI
jgi:hypothetical protein